MTPIDQIRKALEKLEAAQSAGQWNDIDFALSEFFNVADRQAIAALLASHDAAVQRAAELGLALEEQRSIAIEASECADVQRIKAAEMQERCAQVCDDIDIRLNFAGEDNEAAADCAAAIRAIKE